MFILVIAVVIAVLIYLFVKDYKEEKNIKKEFISNEIIHLDTLILFSNAEFANRIKRYYKHKYKNLKFEYADGKYRNIRTSMSKSEIKNSLEEAQDFMIARRYEPDKNYIVKDYITSIIFDVWLDYAYKSNYKILLKRELYRMLDEGTISNSSYNEISKRLRKFKS